MEKRISILIIVLIVMLGINAWVNMNSRRYELQRIANNLFIIDTFTGSGEMIITEEIKTKLIIKNGQFITIKNE
ncbi:MAG: hypothetical protein ACOWWR_13570 [Eubacteriales bacterium]